MTWIAIVALAVIAFGIGFLISGEGRRVWTLLASALVFALWWFATATGARLGDSNHLGAPGQSKRATRLRTEGRT